MIAEISSAAISIVLAHYPRMEDKLDIPTTLEINGCDEDFYRSLIEYRNNLGDEEQVQEIEPDALRALQERRVVCDSETVGSDEDNGSGSDEEQA